MNGDKDALKKLKLDKEDLKELKEKRDMPKLTEEEIWKIAKEKGIKLTDEDIWKIQAGDKEALKKLGLRKEDLKKLKEEKKVPKLTEAQIKEIARQKGITLSPEDIKKIMNGDPEAFKKLKLSPEEKSKLLKQQS